MLISKILLTGAGGYLGRNLAPVLKNNFMVRAHYRQREHSVSHVETNSYGDLLELGTINSVIDGVDCIIHAAAILPSTKTELFDQNYFSPNYEITLNLAEEALKRGLQKFVYVSSANVYSPSFEVATEISATGNFVKHPLYLQSKLDAEKDLLNLFSGKKTQLVITRIGTPFGCDEHKSKLIPTLMNQALKNQNLTLFAPQQTILNYIYMKDLTRAISDLLVRDVSGLFNITSSFTLGNLAEVILNLIDSSTSVISIQESLNSNASNFSRVSSEKFRREVGSKFITLEDSLRDYLSYFEVS